MEKPGVLGETVCTRQGPGRAWLDTSERGDHGLTVYTACTQRGALTALRPAPAPGATSVSYMTCSCSLTERLTDEVKPTKTGERRAYIRHDRTGAFHDLIPKFLSETLREIRYLFAFREQGCRLLPHTQVSRGTDGGERANANGSLHRHGNRREADLVHPEVWGARRRRSITAAA
ncbi:hypothetical protein SKAU_G00166150 [Synaphobranchus kaupii]|uniref:Uncharacterized protein n=1 Tax=Synaphobranchus kaupii TaxID=118154 RepID=A0A9Q1J090_SYNKA|nr:hypothetical protein SKAU_G00166150 [Synaphobranchus kaupii]